MSGDEYKTLNELGHMYCKEDDDPFHVITRNGSKYLFHRNDASEGRLTGIDKNDWGHIEENDDEAFYKIDSDFHEVKGELVDHWPAIQTSHDHCWILSNTLYSSIEEARNDLGQVLRLVKEYPPVKLPRKK